MQIFVRFMKRLQLDLFMYERLCLVAQKSAKDETGSISLAVCTPTDPNRAQLHNFIIKFITFNGIKFESKRLNLSN